jgi:hypothetical protein
MSRLSSTIKMRPPSAAVAESLEVELMGVVAIMEIRHQTDMRITISWDINYVGRPASYPRPALTQRWLDEAPRRAT